MPILLGRQVIGHLGWSVIAYKAKQRQAIVARVCVCVARNRDNRAIMAEGGLSKSSKCSSAGILGIGSSRRQQILPATILGESQSRVVGKMQIDNLGFFTAATALISLFLSHHRFSNLLLPNHQAVKQTNTRYVTELMKPVYIVFKLCSLIVNWRLLIKAFL